MPTLTGSIAAKLRAELRSESTPSTSNDLQRLRRMAFRAHLDECREALAAAAQRADYFDNDTATSPT